MKKLIIFITTGLIAFTSCQKVIDVDLNTVSPQLVIEGVITNDAGPDTIKISKTTNFSASNEFVGVANALVIVTDNTSGLIDTLTQSSQTGVYLTTKINGTPNHQYTMRVVCEGKEYTAQSTMPTPVPLDSVYETHETILGENITYARCKFMDPTDKTNQYRAKVYINNDPQDKILISTYKYYNGLSKVLTLASSNGNSSKNNNNNDKNFNVGDTIKVNFMCIDLNIYNYFYSLEETLNSNSAVSANPVSNISGGCLGYFSANTSEIRKFVIK